jgi:hypothetical protein
MLRVIVFFILFGCIVHTYKSNAQEKYWTWTTGSDTKSQLTTINAPSGIPSSSNSPGSRSGSITWTDASGILWLFGGYGIRLTGETGYLNDLWSFNRLTNQWTWISGNNSSNSVSAIYGTKGVASSLNRPGGRSTRAYWIDMNGEFWMFGGIGHGQLNDFGFLNDLWKLNPQTKMWTWMGGTSFVDDAGNYGTMGVTNSTNLPRARMPGCIWNDQAGNIYLFSGSGNSGSTSGTMNDLWKYNMITGQWTWLKGSNTFHPEGYWGALGISNASNIPNGRTDAIPWKDNSNNLYFFGGFNGKNFVHYNDVWKYNINNNEWTWIKGNNVPYGPYSNGIINVPSSSNLPSAREGGATWTDETGVVWIFGGFNGYSTFNRESSNELWKYDPLSNVFTWMGGTNSTGVYGTIEKSAAGNKPGSRHSASVWKDNVGNVWIFGGGWYSLDKFGGQGMLNDLWRYGQPSPTDFMVTGGGNICPGGTGKTIGLSGSEAGVQYELLFNDNSTGILRNGTGNPLDFGIQTSVGTYKIRAVNQFASGKMSGTASIQLSEVYPVLQLFTNSPVNSGGNLILNVIGGHPIYSTYSWTGPGNFTSSQQNPVIFNSTPGRSGIYTATITTNGCSSSASTNVVINENAKALNFDGINDYITLGNPSALNFGLNDFTLEATVQTSFMGGTAHDFIITKTSTGQDLQYSLGYRAHIDGKVSFSITGANVTGNTSIADGQFHHICVTRQGNTLKLYVDGTLEGATVMPFLVSSTSNNPVIIGGRLATGSDPYFKGTIDEVRFWSRALCISEIQNNLHCELNSNQTGLQAYYKMNQGFINANNSGIAYAIDASGHSLTGSLQNFSLSGNTSNWTNGVVSGICTMYEESEIIITANSSTTICPGSALVLNAGAFAAYQWFKNGIGISNANNNIYNASSAGNYYVEVITEIGCKLKSNTINVIVSQDNQPPDISQPANVYSTTSSDGGFDCAALINIPALVFSDNCGAMLSWVMNGQTIANGNGQIGSHLFNKGVTTIKYTATDGAGLTDMKQMTVTISDNESPVLNCPDDMVVNPLNLAGTPVTYSLTTSDNCGTITLTQLNGLPSGSIFPTGITTNTFRVTDNAGNINECSFTINVRDPFCSNNTNSQKVYVCKDGNTLCVNVNALQSLLNQGAVLGKCEWYTNILRQTDVKQIEPDDRSLKIFPNPVKERMIFIKLNSFKKGQIKINIFNAVGQLIQTDSFIHSGSDVVQQISLKNLAKGIYSMVLFNGKIRHLHKLIIP